MSQSVSEHETSKGSTQYASIHSDASKEDPLLVPTESQTTIQELYNGYNEVVSNLQEGTPQVSMLRTLWEQVEKYRINERKLIDRVIEQNETLLLQTSSLNEAIKENKTCSDSLAEKEVEIIEIKKQVDASHIREQDYQETIEFLRAQIKKLEHDIEVKDQIQAEIDAEMGISGKTREAFTRDKERLTQEIAHLKENFNTVDSLLREYKQRDAVNAEKMEELEKELAVKKNEVNRIFKLKVVVDKEVDELEATLGKARETIVALENSLESSYRTNLKQEDQAVQLKAHCDRLQVENNELITALNQEQEEIYLLNDKMMGIYFANEAAAKQLKADEEKLKKLRIQLNRSENIQDQQLKKINITKNAKDKLLKEVQNLRHDVYDKDKELNKKSVEESNHKRRIEALTREKNLLNKNLLRIAETTEEYIKQIHLDAQVRQNMETERDELRREKYKLGQTILSLEKDKERLLIEQTSPLNRVAEDLKEKKRIQAEMSDYKVGLLEKDARLKQLANTLEAMKTERNNISHSYHEVKDELEDMKNKMKIMHHQAQQLKEDITHKEAQLVKSVLSMRKKNAEKDAIELELKKTREALELSRKNMEKMTNESKALNKNIEAASSEKKSTQKEIDKLLNDSGLLATQLDRRKAELSVVYDKLETMHVILRQGEEQYQQRLEDIRVLKLEVKKLRGERDALVKTFENMSDLRKEIFHLNRDLAVERQKSKALEEEMENPINYHRWRLLEGSDPEKFELIEKVQILQKRDFKTSRDLALTKRKLEEMSELYKATKETLEKVPGIEAGFTILEMKRVIKEKEDTLKATTSEIIVFEEEVEKYKLQLKKTKAELQDVKKKYFALKLKEDERYHKKGEENLKALAPAAASAEGKNVHLGGGFSMTTPMPKVELELPEKKP